jgi:uncharacterized SAM-binding protein YcdF (DUF218 family)
MNKRWTLLGSVLVLIVAVVALHSPLLQALGNALVREDEAKQQLPVAMLLMGDTSPTRAQTALSLYQRGMVKKIVFAQESSSGFIREGYQKSYTQVHIDYLLAKGVALADLVVLGDCVADSTLDEAHCLKAYFARSGEKPAEIYVVTSWYHSARAGWLFDRVFSPLGIRVLMVPALGPESSPVQWWVKKAEFLDVFNEYLKSIYWRIKQPV